MEQKTSSDMGDVKIHNEAISSIASYVVTSIPGVFRLKGSIVEKISERLGKYIPDKGVKTEVTGEDVRIDVSIIVNYGIKIPEVAWQIQKNIRKSVEDMTGLRVVSVNVNIEGVQADVNINGEG